MDMVKLGNLQGTRGALFERANKKYLLYTLPYLSQTSNRRKRSSAATSERRSTKAPKPTASTCPPREWPGASDSSRTMSV